MSKLPRIIPSLLLRNGALVKTQGFRNPEYVGDPINTVRIYNEQGADELIFLDILATPEGAKPNFELIEEEEEEDASVVSMEVEPRYEDGGLGVSMNIDAKW